MQLQKELVSDEEILALAQRCPAFQGVRKYLARQGSPDSQVDIQPHTQISPTHAVNPPVEWTALQKLFDARRADNELTPPEEMTLWLALFSNDHQYDEQKKFYRSAGRRRRLNHKAQAPLPLLDPALQASMAEHLHQPGLTVLDGTAPSSALREAKPYILGLEDQPLAVQLERDIAEMEAKPQEVIQMYYSLWMCGFLELTPEQRKSLAQFAASFGMNEIAKTLQEPMATQTQQATALASPEEILARRLNKALERLHATPQDALIWFYLFLRDGWLKPTAEQCKVMISYAQNLHLDAVVEALLDFIPVDPKLPEPIPLSERDQMRLELLIARLRGLRPNTPVRDLEIVAHYGIDTNIRHEQFAIYILPRLQQIDPTLTPDDLYQLARYTLQQHDELASSNPRFERLIARINDPLLYLPAIVGQIETIHPGLTLDELQQIAHYALQPSYHESSESDDETARIAAVIHDPLNYFPHFFIQLSRTYPNLTLTQLHEAMSYIGRNVSETEKLSDKEKFNINIAQQVQTLFSFISNDELVALANLANSDDYLIRIQHLLALLNSPDETDKTGATVTAAQAATRKYLEAYEKEPYLLGSLDLMQKVPPDFLFELLITQANITRADLNRFQISGESVLSPRHRLLILFRQNLDEFFAEARYFVEKLHLFSYERVVMFVANYQGAIFTEEHKQMLERFKAHEVLASLDPLTKRETVDPWYWEGKQPIKRLEHRTAPIVAALLNQNQLLTLTELEQYSLTVFDNLFLLLASGNQQEFELLLNEVSTMTYPAINLADLLDEVMKRYLRYTRDNTSQDSIGIAANNWLDTRLGKMAE